jgi:hypothetical protein
MKKKTKRLVLSKETIGTLVTGPHVAAGVGVTQPGRCETRFCTVGCTLECSYACQSGEYPC